MNPTMAAYDRKRNRRSAALFALKVAVFCALLCLAFVLPFVGSLGQ